MRSCHVSFGEFHCLSMQRGPQAKHDDGRASDWGASVTAALEMLTDVAG